MRTRPTDGASQSSRWRESSIVTSLFLSQSWKQIMIEVNSPPIKETKKLAKMFRHAQVLWKHFHVTIHVRSNQSETDCETQKYLLIFLQSAAQCKQAAVSPPSSFNTAGEKKTHWFQTGNQRYAREKLINDWKSLHQCKCCYWWQWCLPHHTQGTKQVRGIQGYSLKVRF